MGRRLERIRDLALRKVAYDQHRSDKWQVCRTAWLKRQPNCQVCGGTEKRQVHHIRPVHKFQDLELDPSNLITLCEGKTCNHHLLFGHLGNFRSWNMDVRGDAVKWGAKIRARPY